MGLHAANSDVGRRASRSLTFSLFLFRPCLNFPLVLFLSRVSSQHCLSLPSHCICLGKQSLNTMLSPRDTNSGSASLQNPRRERAGAGIPKQGEAPCLRLEPAAMKEFSFLGVFACVLGCASKPLPTHLYANESSHMLGMFCPQILNTMYRRWAQLLQKRDLRGGQFLPAVISLYRFYPELEKTFPRI